MTGIGTDVGKTIVSATMVEALKADYWKPVQAGDLENSDSILMEQLISNSKTTIHPERFQLNTPASPHYAAAVDGITIDLSDFNLPITENHLIVEGAGGLLVPLNNQDTILDLIQHLKIPVILAINFYLGSINHSLLSIEILKARKIPIHAIVFNGEINIASRGIIEKRSGNYVSQFLEIPQLKSVDPSHIQSAAKSVAEKIAL